MGQGVQMCNTVFTSILVCLGLSVIHWYFGGCGNRQFFFYGLVSDGSNFFSFFSTFPRVNFSIDLHITMSSFFK